MATVITARPFLHRHLLLLLLIFVEFEVISSETDPGDVTVLRALMDEWENTPPSWKNSDDPCGSCWEGVTCNDSRVTALKLSTMGLKGSLGGDIGGLGELRSLDLSYNRELTGSLSPQLGQLRKLNLLILAGCRFSGRIPDELGNLSELYFLALNSNNFTGEIPPSLGNLSKVYWFDLSDNQLTGSLPVSTDSTSGLDLLLQAGHFHLNKNQFSGPIPPKLFSPGMQLIHIILHGNQLTGTIPSTIGHVKNLEVLRLDRNFLTGEVPSNLNNLTDVIELNLGHNQLTGQLPNLAGMDSLQYLDLSNNQFDASHAPKWFSTLSSLVTLAIENGTLTGVLPEELFRLPQLQQVRLKNNSLNGNLDMSDGISQSLKLVDLQQNKISTVTIGPSYNNTLILIDNPCCSRTQLSGTKCCQLQQQNKEPYSTSRLVNCGFNTCAEIGQKLSPGSCECTYPYEGTLYLYAPSFRDLYNASLYHALEMDIWMNLNLTPGSVSLQNLSFNIYDEIQMKVALFPSSGLYFDRSEVQRIGFALSNQTYKVNFSLGFGPYYFIADPYIFQDNKHGKSAPSRGLTIGISIVGTLFVMLVGVGMYANWKKKRVEKVIEHSKPFVWASRRKESSDAPQVKGARWFSYNELKKCTSNFSSSNEIGTGGYGMVYKGMLPDGQLVAVKRAHQASLQCGPQFKTEIELLSRVHHKNLVDLVGFRFEQGEQILVYEFMPNGSLRDSLAGKSGIYLDWKKRLRIALGSARGLAYLHELASPAIIHRDVKSSNILLDENLNAKVADFGLSKLLTDGGKDHLSTQVKGTMGYLDPEYYLNQQLTQKSDVFSFGVVMLELLTAKQPIEKGKYIVREVITALDKADREFCCLKGLLDPSISSAGLAGLPGLAMFVELALRCVEDSGSSRPTMGAVVKAIENILQNDGISVDTTLSPSSSITDVEDVRVV